MPERTEDAALRGVLHITIGGESVQLRTLTLDESDEWLDMLADHLSAIELPDTGGQEAIKGALTMPAQSARGLVAAYDLDHAIEDIGKASKRELKEAFEQMVSAEDPFGEGVARSVAAAYGAPARIMAEMLAYVLNQPLPVPSTTGPSSDTVSPTAPSGGSGPASSSSSAGPTPIRRRKSG